LTVRLLARLIRKLCSCGFEGRRWPRDQCITFWWWFASQFGLSQLSSPGGSSVSAKICALQALLLIICCVSLQINQITRINEIYTSQVFDNCQNGFGFQIQMVSDCGIVCFFLEPSHCFQLH